ncbi:MAG: cell surface protein SprA, partial [Fibrobacteres bacterium]|nr:cell surface protein SprA [Fibrobacterota bacterium]
ILLAAFNFAGASILDSYRLTPSRQYSMLIDSAMYPATLLSPEAALLKLNAKNVKRATFIDYTKKEAELILYYSDPDIKGMSVKRDSLVPGIIMSSFLFMELNEYIRYINAGENAAEFTAGSPFFSLVERKKKSFNPLDIEIPVKLPAWARRFVGSEGPRIKITGSVKLIAGGNSHWIEGAQDASSQNEGFPNITFDTEMNFSVSGKIGRLLDVNINMSTANQSSGEDIADQLKKQLKLHYKGETPDELEDEILQEVEAGYTGFSMQGEEFSGYSVSGNDGLFGVKAKLKFGDLNVTAVAAQENVKSEKKDYNPKSNETVQTKTEREVQYDKMFFLDSLFMNSYYNPATRHGRSLLKVYLFKKDPSVTNDNATQFQETHKQIGDGYYKIMRPEANQYGQSEFYIDQNNKGYVVLSVPLNSTDQLLAWFEYKDSVGTKSSSDLGLLYFHNDKAVAETVYVDNRLIRPYVLRPVHMDASVPQWKLMCKHVYELGSVDPQNRKDVSVVISYQDTTTNQFFNSIDVNKINKPEDLVKIFGLNDELGVLKVADNDIFLFDYGALILPPILGPQPFNSDSLPKDLPLNKGIYEYPKEQHEAKGVKARYRIDIKSRAASATFSLGVMDVVEGSEVIRAGGVTLVRDVDYTIMYDIGQVSLISEKATSSMKDLSVEYQYSPYFNIDERTFVGVRADYQLENIGTGSRVSASWLRKAETGQDKRAQLGREPTSNMLFDAYATLSWEPKWMTSIINKVPGINTDQKSKLSVQGEVARSIVNPNTSDRNEAVVDDFEDSKTLFPVSLSDIAWRWASQPDTSIIGKDAVTMQCWGGNGRDQGIMQYSGRFAWVSPAGIREKDIWPNTVDLQATVSVLRMEMAPHKLQMNGAATGIASEEFRKKSWGGAMASLGYGVKDQLENSQFLELWVLPTGSRGLMHIDLGELSEDLRIGYEIDGTKNSDTNTYVLWNSKPDGKYNTEYFLGDNAISTRNDVGLDMRRDAYEKFILPYESVSPPGISYDTIGINEASDPGGDNYSYSDEIRDSIRGYNGTEMNSTGRNFDRTRQSADNEDLFNNNGLVDTRSSYHHYWIDLAADTLDPYYVSKANSGWRLYRIPLHNRKITGRAEDSLIPYKINNPVLSKANGIRIWMNGITGLGAVNIARMEIVGNRWASRDTAAPDSSKPKLKVSVANTVDNDDYNLIRPSSDLIPIYNDNSSGNREREQALRLEYSDLAKPFKEIKAERNYSRGMDFRLYKKLSLYYYPIVQNQAGRHEYIFIRFGSDSASFYEYKVRKMRYNAWNTMNINLNDLATFKENILSLRADKRAPVDSSMVQPDSAIIRVKGYPTYADIKWFSIGVARDTTDNSSYSGLVYVNDLKLLEPDKLEGNAARLKLTADFADVLSFNTGVYYKDGSFLKLNEKQANGGASEMAVDASVSFPLNRMLPASWGLSIPLSATVSSTIQRPRFIPSSDASLTDDGLKEILPDLYNRLLGNKTDKPDTGSMVSEDYETVRNQKTFSTSFKKTTQSDNLAVNILLDRISINGGWSETMSESPNRADTSESVNSTLTYSATPRTEKVFEPFVKRGEGFIKEHFGDLKLRWYPSSLEFTLYNTQYSTTREGTRANPRLDFIGLNNKSTMTMSHSYNMNYSGLLDWKYLKIDFTHSNSVDRNLNSALAKLGDDYLNFADKSVFGRDPQFMLADGSRFILEGETGNTQSFSYTVNPVVFSWFTHRLSYNSNFGLGVKQGKIGLVENRYLDLSSSTGLTADLEWQFLDMFEKLNTGILKGKGDPVVKPVKSFLDKLGFTRIGFNYSINQKKNITGLKTVPLEIPEYFLFKAGFYGSTPLGILTGDGDHTAFGGWKYAANHRDEYVDPTRVASNDGREVDLTGSTSASFNIPLPIKLSLNLSTSFGKRWAESGMKTNVDTTFNYPNFTISTTISDAIKLFKYIPVAGDFIQTAALNSSYQYSRDLELKFSDVVNSEPWESNKLKYTFAPLARLTFDLKNKMHITDDFNYSRERNFSTDNTAGIKGRENETWSNKASLTYSFAKQQPIKFLMWEFSFDNQLSLNFDWTLSHTTDYEWLVRDGNGKIYRSLGEYEKDNADVAHINRTLSYAVTAGASYKISAKVDAGGTASYKRDLKVLPGLEDDADENHPEYDIALKLWVQWVF